MIEHINQTARKHIITLEDPIEYLFTDRMAIIEQREVGLDTTTFASGLKNVLRQDPDVLVIGEMRDPGKHLGCDQRRQYRASRDLDPAHRRCRQEHPAHPRIFSERRSRLGTPAARDPLPHAVICQKLIPSTQGGVVPAAELLVNTTAVAKLIQSGTLEKLPATIEMGTGETECRLSIRRSTKW